LKKLQLEEPDTRVAGQTRVDGVMTAEDGAAQVSAVCLKRPQGPLALVVMQAPGGSSTLVSRMAATVR
jgi:hypothetical protein